jgi:hypothetical protein
MKNFLPSNNDNPISDRMFENLLEHLKNYIEPVTVNFSNEVLAQQHYNIGILLFILTLLTIVILIFFIINLLIYINSDRILNLFKNKIIKTYVNFNLKFIKIEVFFLSCTLIYFLYSIAFGLHYLVTHPIILS